MNAIRSMIFFLFFIFSLSEATLLESPPPKSERSGGLLPPPKDGPGGGIMAPPTRKRPRKPKAPVKKTLPILSAQELQRLTAAEKKKSDEIFIEKLINLSNECFPGSIDNYVGELKNGLKGLNKEGVFKKRGELLGLVGKSVRDKGSLYSFVVDKIKTKSNNLKDFLKGFYSEIANPETSSLFVEFLSLLEHCVFDKNLLQNPAQHDVATILINLIVGLRASEEGNEIKSDNAVADVFDAFVKDKNPSLLKLSWEINRLRIHYRFLKFEYLLGSASVARAQGLGPILAAKSKPLLAILRDKNADKKEFFPVKNLTLKIEYQLFFSPDDFFEIKKGTPGYSVLENSIKKHIEYLKKQQAAFDIYSYLKDSLANAKDIFVIKRVIKSLGAKPLSKSDKALQESITKELYSVSLNANNVMNGIVKLCKNKRLPFEDDIKNILLTHQRKMKVASAILKVLKEVKDIYRRKGKTLGKILYEKMLKIAEIRSEVEKEYKNLYRSPMSIRRFIQRYVTGPELENLASSDDFYKWVEPYGAMMKIFKQVAERKECLQDLLYALRALHIARIAPEELLKLTRGEESDYVKAVKEFEDVIAGGAYKGKLWKMIDDFSQFDLDGAKNTIEVFVKLAGMGIEKTNEYRKIIDTLMKAIAKQKYEEIKQELNTLDEGKSTMKGLELKGVGRQKIVRNMKLYKKMKGMFKPINDSIGASIKKFANIDVEPEESQFNRSKSDFLNKLGRLFESLGYSQGDKSEVITHIKAYFDNLESRLLKVKKNI